MTTSSKLTTGLTDLSSILGPIRDIRKSCSHWPFDVTLKYFFTFKILPSLIWVKLVQKFLCWKMSSKFSFAHDDDVELLTVFCKSHLKSRSWNDQMSSRHKIAFDLSQQWSSGAESNSFLLLGTVFHRSELTCQRELYKTWHHQMVVIPPQTRDSSRQSGDSFESRNAINWTKTVLLFQFTTNFFLGHF